MKDPFVSQSVSISDNEEPPNLLVFWQIQYERCDWTLWIITANFSLYPNPFSSNLPIAKNNEYNLTLSDKCDGEAPVKTINMNASLSIQLNDNVIEHVPYVICLLSRLDSLTNMTHYHRSKRVYLHSYVSITESTTQHSMSTQEILSLLTSNSTQLTVITTTMPSSQYDSITSSAANTIVSYQDMSSCLGALFSLITLIL